MNNLDKMKLNEILLLDAFDQAPIGVVVASREKGVILDVNDEFCSMLLCSRKELIGKTFADITHPYDLEKSHELHLEIKNNHRGRLVIEKRYLNRKGEPVWGELSARLIVLADESEIILGYIKDISQRKQKELDLAVSESRYRELYDEFRLLLSSLPENITLWDSALQPLWNNRENDCAGPVDINSILHGPDPGINNFIRDLLHECFEQRTQLERVVRFGRHSLQCRVVPVLEKNDPVKVISIVRDISREQELKAEAEKASRMAALGELSAGIAHEINNPNAMILMHVDVMKDVLKLASELMQKKYEQEGDFAVGRMPYSRLAEKIPDLVHNIQDSARRIKDIVNDLNEFVRIEKKEPRKDVEIVSLIERCLSLIRKTMLKNKGTIEFCCMFDNYHIPGEPHRLEQVVLNLLINAVQSFHHFDHSIKVSLSTEPRFLVLTINDDGAGIESENLNRVTEPFFTTRRETGSTGLGLSIASRIVSDHGGQLSFDSEPGKGTTAMLRLPIKKETQR